MADLLIMRHSYRGTNQPPVPLMMSQVSRPAIKTQKNRHGNVECAAMVVMVAVGEGLREGKRVYVCVIQWCLGRPVESAVTQKSVQLQEEKRSTVY